MGSRRVVYALLVALLVLGLLPYATGCGEETATIRGSVPAACLPLPSGDVVLAVVPSADLSAEPVTTFTTDSSLYNLEVPPGSYVVRVLSPRGEVLATSEQVDVRAGEDAEATFDAP